MTNSICFLYNVADIISCVEFSPDGELLATGDKGGRVVIFKRDSSVSSTNLSSRCIILGLIDFFFFC